jgi:hypothetical protein
MAMRKLYKREDPGKDVRGKWGGSSPLHSTRMAGRGQKWNPSFDIGFCSLYFYPERFNDR